MAEITDHDPANSPTGHDDAVVGNGNGSLASGDTNRGIKRQRPSAADDDDDDDDKPGRERRKIEIKFIQDKSRRHITFSKRKAGIMKKVRVRDRASTLQPQRVASMHTPYDRCILTTCPRRRTSSLSLPARKYYCLWCPRLDWYTPSRHRSFNHLSPSPKARTSSR